MNQAERLAFLDDLAARRVSLRDVADLDESALGALLRLATSAYQGGRYDDAASLFAFLEALEPARAEHSLFRGHACAAAGLVADARCAFARYLARDDAPADERARARAFLAGLSS